MTELSAPPEKVDATGVVKGANDGKVVHLHQAAAVVSAPSRVFTGAAAATKHAAAATLPSSLNMN